MKVNRNQFFVVLILLVATIVYVVRSGSVYPITNRYPSGGTIIAFGDSLTFGTGAGRGEDWPSVVSELCNCEIINKGVPGETTGQALSRVQRDVLALNPRVVIIGLGGNDVLQRLSTDNLFSNLRQIIETVQASGAVVILLGLDGFLLASDLGDGYKKLARETGSVYVSDILAGILTNSRLKSDQIHPNAEGYRMIADRIYSKAREYLVP